MHSFRSAPSLSKTVGALGIGLAMLAVSTTLTAQAPPEVKPGPEHALLNQSEGAWDMTIKSMGGDSKGTATCKVDLNGLWLFEQVKVDFGGMGFEGRGATSYDPSKKKYVNVWIDSMSTSPAVSEGTYDKSKKTLTLVGDMPMPDGKIVKTTQKTEFKDDNTKVFTMTTAGPGGKDIEMMQITYKRRAK